MPCYRTTELTVNLGAITSTASLDAALKALGYSVHREGDVVHFGTRLNGGVINNDGTVTLRGNATTALSAPIIKRAYSVELVKAAGKRFGWGTKIAKTGKIRYEKAWGR